MAGQVQLNLNHYPTLVKWYLDERIDELKYRKKAAGYLFWQTMVSFAYNTSYYFSWTTISKRRVCEIALVTEEECDDILSCCFELGIFDKGLFDDYNIITSFDIQEGYCKCSTRKTKVLLVKEYLLVPPVYYNRLKVTLTNLKGEVLPVPKNDEISPRLATPVVASLEKLKNTPASFNHNTNASEPKAVPVPVTPVTPKNESLPDKNEENLPEWLKKKGEKFSYSYEEIRQELIKPYEKRDELFKNQVPEKIWKGFVAFYKFMANKYPQFQRCQNQLTLPQYQKLKEEEPSPSGEKLREALYRLSRKGNYLTEGDFFFERLQEALRWIDKDSKSPPGGDVKEVYVRPTPRTPLRVNS